MVQKITPRAEDDSFLFQLYSSTRMEELQAYGWNEQMQHTFLTMQWMAQHRSYAIQYPNAEHHIICIQNIRVGRILVASTDQELTLVDFALLPEYRNQGIGTALLKELQAKASDTGKSLRLHVLQDNPAKRLYERLGFTTTGCNGLYESMEWCAVTS